MEHFTTDHRLNLILTMFGSKCKLTFLRGTSFSQDQTTTGSMDGSRRRWNGKKKHPKRNSWFPWLVLWRPTLSSGYVVILFCGNLSFYQLLTLLICLIWSIYLWTICTISFFVGTHCLFQQQEIINSSNLTKRFGPHLPNNARNDSRQDTSQATFPSLALSSLQQSNLLHPGTHMLTHCIDLRSWGTNGCRDMEASRVVLGWRGYRSSCSHGWFPLVEGREAAVLDQTLDSTSI